MSGSSRQQSHERILGGSGIRSSFQPSSLHTEMVAMATAPFLASSVLPILTHLFYLFDYTYHQEFHNQEVVNDSFVVL